MRVTVIVLFRDNRINGTADIALGNGPVNVHHDDSIRTVPLVDLNGGLANDHNRSFCIIITIIAHVVMANTMIVIGMLFGLLLLNITIWSGVILHQHIARLVAPVLEQRGNFSQCVGIMLIIIVISSSIVVRFLWLPFRHLRSSFVVIVVVVVQMWFCFFLSRLLLLNGLIDNRPSTDLRLMIVISILHRLTNFQHDVVASILLIVTVVVLTIVIIIILVVAAAAGKFVGWLVPTT